MVRNTQSLAVIPHFSRRRLIVLAGIFCTEWRQTLQYCLVAAAAGAAAAGAVVAAGVTTAERNTVLGDYTASFKV